MSVLRHLYASRCSLVFIGALAFILSACSNDSTSPGERQSATALRRLLVADAVSATASMIDLRQPSTIQAFTLSGGVASLVYASHSGRYAVIQQRTSNRVQFFDGGVWLDGNTARLRPAAWLPNELNDVSPTHENVNGPWISIFFDGTGMARWIDERELLAGSFRVAQEISSGGPQHSGSATLPTATGAFFVYAPLNPAGGLPTSVIVMNEQRQEVGRSDACPSMHGNGSNKDAVVFGCLDGAIMVRTVAGAATVTKLTPSGSLVGLGVRTIWGEHDAPFLVGQLSSPSGMTPARRVLATIDPATGAMHEIPLASGLTNHALAIDPYTNRIIVLTTDGDLRIFNGTTRTLQTTIDGIVPGLPSTGALTHGIAVADGVAYVASPTTGTVVEIDTDQGRVLKRIPVGGQPSRIALLGVGPRGTFPIAD